MWPGGFTGPGNSLLCSSLAQISNCVSKRVFFHPASEMFTKDLFHFSADVANHVRGLEATADETKASETRHCVHRKLFGGTFAKNEKDKLKNIREDEGETPLSDAGIDVDVDIGERLLDVGNNFASIRILERRYRQPIADNDVDVDVEMATVLITFPRNCNA